jgi:Uma2 family endonuclease
MRMSRPFVKGETARYSCNRCILFPGNRHCGIPDADLCRIPGPRIRHHVVALKIAAALLRYVENRKLGQVLLAPCDVFLSEKIVVRPDVFFVKRERRGLIGERSMRGTPDLVIEVLSQATREQDLKTKRIYAHFEIPEYWAVDPDMGTAEALVWSELGYVSLGTRSKSGRLSSLLLPSFNLRLSDVLEPDDA